MSFLTPGDIPDPGIEPAFLASPALGYADWPMPFRNCPSSPELYPSHRNHLAWNIVTYNKKGTRKIYIRKATDFLYI